MKIRRIFWSGAVACLFSAVTVCAVFATPVFAQAPNPKAEAYFQKFLADHPEVRSNPSLMSDPRWLNAHPSFHKFLEDHPNVARQAHQMAHRGGHGGAYGTYGAHGTYGDYDEKHQWHDRDWWLKNRFPWVQQHHPDWVRGAAAPPPSHPAYGTAYGHPAGMGAYDEKHQWHDSNWWVSNKREWVQQHHPEWVQHHDHDHH